jgi:hypothetical protein
MFAVVEFVADGLLCWDGVCMQNATGIVCGVQADEENTPILLWGLPFAPHDDVLRVCVSAGGTWTDGRMRRV